MKAHAPLAVAALSVLLCICLCGCSVAGGLLEAAGDFLDSIELPQRDNDTYTLDGQYKDCPAHDYFSDSGLVRAVHDEICDIRDHDITPERLATITELRIDSENLDGVEHLTGLEILTIYFKGTGADLKRLEALSGLKELDIRFYNEQVQPDLEPLAVHTGLTRLALDFYHSGQEAPPLDFIAGYPDLRELSLGFPHGRPRLDMLAGLELELLELERCYVDSALLPATAHIGDLRLSLCTVEELSALAALVQLPSLLLYDCDLHDLSALPHIPGLWELHIEACDFDRFDLLPQMRQLTSLSLPDTELEAIDFVEALTDLTYLDLKWNRIRDLSPLSGLTGLEYLNLTVNEIQDATPLAELTNLTYLSLGGNLQITDASPLRDMVKLERLSLGGTLVTDLAPLAGMTELRILDLGSDAFDKFDYGVMDLTPLSGMLKLEKLDLERNVLTDFTPLAELAEILGPEAFKECIGHPTILVPIETITLTDNRIVPILTCKIPIAPDGTPVTMEKYNYASQLEVVGDGTLRFHSNLTPVDEEVASMFAYTAEDMIFDGVVLVHATREEIAYIHAGQP